MGSPASWGDRRVRGSTSGPGTRRCGTWPARGGHAGSQAWGNPACSTSSLCAPWTQGWLLLESPAMSYGQATPYLPVRDLLKALLPARRPGRCAHRYTRRSRQAVSRWMKPSGTDHPSRCWRSWTSAGRQSRGRLSIRPNAASGPSTRSSACCCGRVRPSRAPRLRKPPLDRHRDPGVAR